jgi:predicted 3-demethylubiquinone-9 3-methyltransferase (glyoxalase superfamily)
MKQKITTFLTFKDQAEEAVKLYTSIFKNSRILSTSRYGDAGPGPKGSVMSANFEIDGQEFVALNGGPSFSFSEGMSLYVDCETQAEVDDLWKKLSAGGSEGRCGWLTDRFGVSWQVIPRVLPQLLSDPDPEKAGRAMNAMLQMGKIEIAKLEQATEGGAVEATSGR